MGTPDNKQKRLTREAPTYPDSPSPILPDVGSGVLGADDSICS